MKAVNFPRANADFGNVPAWIDNKGRAIVFVALEPGDIERIHANGGVWIDVMTDKRGLQPFSFRSVTPFFGDHPECYCPHCKKPSLRPFPPIIQAPGAQPVWKCINADCKPPDQRRRGQNHNPVKK